MSAEVAYLDTSAAVKLLMTERESPALRRWLRRRPARASAALLRVELVRVVRRSGLPRLIPEARKLLAAVRVSRLDDALLDHAADLDPNEHRSLDSIHGLLLPREPLRHGGCPGRRLRRHLDATRRALCGRFDSLPHGGGPRRRDARPLTERGQAHRRVRGLREPRLQRRLTGSEHINSGILLRPPPP